MGEKRTGHFAFGIASGRAQARKFNRSEARPATFRVEGLMIRGEDQCAPLA